MYTKTLLLLGLAAAALAEPVPQGTTDADAFPTAFDSSSLGSELSSLTADLNVFSDMPTLPASINSILATAIPTNVAGEDPCATTEPAWLKNLPGDVKSALTSYESQLESWYSKHSSVLGNTFTGAIPTADGVCTDVLTPDATAAPGGPTGKTTAAPGSSSSGKGVAASSTAAGAAASSTNSPGAGAHPTGAIAAGVAGVVGMVGVMLAL